MQLYTYVLVIAYITEERKVRSIVAPDAEIDESWISRCVSGVELGELMIAQYQLFLTDQHGGGGLVSGTTATTTVSHIKLNGSNTSNNNGVASATATTTTTVSSPHPSSFMKTMHHTGTATVALAPESKSSKSRSGSTLKSKSKTTKSESDVLSLDLNQFNNTLKGKKNNKNNSNNESMNGKNKSKSKNKKKNNNECSTNDGGGTSPNCNEQNVSNDKMDKISKIGDNDSGILNEISRNDLERVLIINELEDDDDRDSLVDARKLSLDTAGTGRDESSQKHGSGDYSGVGFPHGMFSHRSSTQHTHTTAGQMLNTPSNNGGGNTEYEHGTICGTGVTGTQTTRTERDNDSGEFGSLVSTNNHRLTPYNSVKTNKTSKTSKTRNNSIQSPTTNEYTGNTSHKSQHWSDNDSTNNFGSLNGNGDRNNINSNVNRNIRGGSQSMSVVTNNTIESMGRNYNNNNNNNNNYNHNYNVSTVIENSSRNKRIITNDTAFTDTTTTGTAVTAVTTVSATHGNTPTMTAVTNLSNGTRRANQHVPNIGNFVGGQVSTDNNVDVNRDVNHNLNLNLHLHRERIQEQENTRWNMSQTQTLTTQSHRSHRSLISTQSPAHSINTFNNQGMTVARVRSASTASNNQNSNNNSINKNRNQSVDHLVSDSDSNYKSNNNRHFFRRRLAKKKKKTRTKSKDKNKSKSKSKRKRQQENIHSDFDIIIDDKKAMTRLKSRENTRANTLTDIESNISSTNVDANRTVKKNIFTRFIKKKSKVNQLEIETEREIACQASRIDDSTKSTNNVGDNNHNTMAALVSRNSLPMCSKHEHEKSIIKKLSGLSFCCFLTYFVFLFIKYEI